MCKGVALMCVKVHSCTGDFNSFLLCPKKKPPASCVSLCHSPEKSVGCLHSFSNAVMQPSTPFQHCLCCHHPVVGVKDGGQPGGVDPDLPRLPSPPPPRPTQPWVDAEERINLLHVQPDNKHLSFTFANYVYPIHALSLLMGTWTMMSNLRQVAADKSLRIDPHSAWSFAPSSDS